jgi:hypothetical protein
LLERQQALIEAQGREIEQLRRRVEQMEQRIVTPREQAAAPDGQETLTVPSVGQVAGIGQSQALPEISPTRPDVGDFPGAFPIPNSDAKLRIGGQIRMLLLLGTVACGRLPLLCDRPGPGHRTVHHRLVE